MQPAVTTTRRVFLRSTALAALAPAGCKSLGGSATRGNIDAHVHVWTSDTRGYPLASGFHKADMKPASFTPEELFAHCKPEGVNRVVLIQMSYYGFDNRYMLEAIANHPGVFRGVAIVDDSRNDVCETMRSLSTRGVRGFRLYADTARTAGWANSSNMHAMWSCAAEAGLSMCLLADPGALPDVERMCRRHPGTRVVIDHFARIGMNGTVSPADLDILCRLSEFPHTYVKTSAFYALGAKKAPYTDLAPMIRRLRDSYGAARLMWASDCPFQVEEGHTYANSIGLIRDRLDFLTEEDRRWMLRGTAEKVFFS